MPSEYSTREVSAVGLTGSLESPQATRFVAATRLKAKVEMRISLSLGLLWGALRAHVARPWSKPRASGKEAAVTGVREANALLRDAERYRLLPRPGARRGLFGT